MVKRLVGLFLVVFIAGCGIIWQQAKQSLAEPLAQQGPFIVAKGTSLQALMRDLQGQGVSTLTIRLQRKILALQGIQNIQAGEYLLKPEYSLQDILHIIAAGQVMQRQFTLLEGWTIRQSLAYLDDVVGLEDDINAETWHDFLISLGLDPQYLGEGWFAPDTYYFNRGQTQRELLTQSHQQMLTWLEAAWQKRSTDLPLSSPYDLLILASIVEKETGLASERPFIASVFINRLRQGMRLQTDPTVIYGLGESFDGDLRRRDLSSDSPYNTYKISGLPPTPIALPSQNALLAVVTAPETDYLYFVAKGDGSSYFSKTLDEHQRAVREYQLSGRRSDYQSAPQ